jgi:hypothetical protein
MEESHENCEDWHEKGGKHGKYTTSNCSMLSTSYLK